MTWTEKRNDPFHAGTTAPGVMNLLSHGSFQYHGYGLSNPVASFLHLYQNALTPADVADAVDHVFLICVLPRLLSILSE